MPETFEVGDVVKIQGEQYEIDGIQREKRFSGRSSAQIVTLLQHDAEYKVRKEWLDDLVHQKFSA